MSKNTNIMIVGVGGQGTLLASRIMGAVTMERGFDAKLSEVHGMSQRGGSVVTYVKYGDKVYSPVIDKGEADYILAFEPLEAARYVTNLKKDGCMIVNDQQILPMPVITGSMAYPENIVEKMRAVGARVLSYDALALATQAGLPRAVNVVLIGVLSNFLEFEEAAWIRAIETTVRQEYWEMNKTAFSIGRTAGQA